MPNYAEGCIYKITSSHTDKVYIGSTAGSIQKRLIGHRSNLNRYKQGRFHYLT